jgi:hypothetical protein
VYIYIYIYSQRTTRRKNPEHGDLQQQTYSLQKFKYEQLKTLDLRVLTSFSRRQMLAHFTKKVNSNLYQVANFQKYTFEVFADDRLHYATLPTLNSLETKLYFTFNYPWKMRISFRPNAYHFTVISYHRIIN